MSIVAVRKYKTKIMMACDSQTTLYGIMKDKTEKVKTRSKILDSNGMLIGIVGLVRDSSYMQIFMKSHRPAAATEDSVLDFMVEFTEWSRKKDNKFELESNYIIVYKNKVFFVEEGLLVDEVSEFNAIGSGCFYALTALHLGKGVKEAVEIAKELDIYCSGETKTYIKYISNDKH